MAFNIGFLTQKGGPGKSTLCTLLARELANVGTSVRIADMDSREDVSQQTTYLWSRRRRERGHLPDIPVETYRSAGDVPASDHVFTLFDGKAYADRETWDIARVCNGIIIPVIPSIFDVEAFFAVYEELKNRMAAGNRILVVLNGVLGHNDGDAATLRRDLRELGCNVCENELRMLKCYRNAAALGLAPSEAFAPRPRIEAKHLAEEIATFMLENLNG